VNGGATTISRAGEASGEAARTSEIGNRLSTSSTSSSLGGEKGFSHGSGSGFGTRPSTRRSRRASLSGRASQPYLSVGLPTPRQYGAAEDSTDAPPPVEMCVILPVTPALATADTESPPPTIVCRSLRQRRVPRTSCRRRTGWFRTRPLGHSTPTVFAPADNPATSRRSSARCPGPSARRWPHRQRQARLSPHRPSIFSATTWSTGSSRRTPALLRPSPPRACRVEFVASTSDCAPAALRLEEV